MWNHLNKGRDGCYEAPEVGSVKRTNTPLETPKRSSFGEHHPMLPFCKLSETTHCVLSPVWGTQSMRQCHEEGFIFHVVPHAFLHTLPPNLYQVMF